MIPLDKRQLRAWREYLELEAADGDHHSRVQLYERCLIACAQYEEFWMQYARYLEKQMPGVEAAGKQTNTAAVAAAAAEAITAGPGAADDAAVQKILTADQTGRTEAASYETESQRLPEERADVGAGISKLEDPADAVREVYKRACLVHCPTKPNVRMQWAAFEESVGESRHDVVFWPACCLTFNVAFFDKTSRSSRQRKLAEVNFQVKEHANIEVFYIRRLVRS